MTFCSGCGSEIPADAGFCPKCGKAVGVGPGIDPHDMKREMKDAYRADRHAYRQARREARWGMRMEHPEWALINTIFGGLIIILLGVLFYMASTGLSPLVTWSNFWAYFLLGIGLLFLVRGLLAFFFMHRPFEQGSIIAGVIITTIGAAGLGVTTYGMGQYLWIGVIVLVGVLVILAGVLTYLFRKP